MVLVLLLVGVAIIVAVYLFDESAAAANLDRVTEFLMELGGRAQMYYRTPVWLDGGGHSFANLTADDQGMARLTNSPVNEYGTFSILVAGTATQITLQGVGVEDGDRDGTNCTASLQVFPDSMAMTIVNR